MKLGYAYNFLLSSIGFFGPIAMIQQQKVRRIAGWVSRLALISLLSGCSEMDSLRRYVMNDQETPQRSTQGKLAERAPATEKRPLPSNREMTGGRPLRSGYACCNLHYSGDTVAESAYGQQSFIAAGTPMSIRRIEGNRIDIEVAGKAMRIQADPNRSAASIDAWLAKLILPEDPRPRLNAWPSSVQAAIALGQLSKGMTREQVTTALGPPPGDGNGATESAYWRYWWANYVPVYVHWSKAGTLLRITGPAEAINALSFRGER